VTSLGVALLVWMLLEPVCVAPEAASPLANQDGKQGAAPHENCWEGPEDLHSWRDSSFESDVEEGVVHVSHPTERHRHSHNYDSPAQEHAGSWVSDAHAPTASNSKLRFNPGAPGFSAGSQGGAQGLPQRIANQMWELLLGARKSSAGMAGGAGAPPPQLTHSLLLAHSSLGAGQPHGEPHERYWQPPAPYVPRAPADWRSAEARRARWLRACQEMASARSDAGETASVAPTDASRATTVPGGGKGHALGRASRKQLAMLLTAIWKQFYDNFGRAVPGAPADGDLVLEVCDALTEILHIDGVQTLLHWRDQQRSASPASTPRSAASTSVPSSPAARSCSRSRPASPGVAAPFHRARSAQFDGAGDGAAPDRAPKPHGARAEVLPELPRALCRHANATWVLSEHVAVLRSAIAAASTSPEWLPPAQACPAWQEVCVGIQSAWTAEADSRSATEPRSPAADDAGSSVRITPGSTDEPSASGAPDGGVQHNALFPAAATPEQLLLTLGLWCIAALLQLSAVEPRPELWGRYVAALNHLQGVLLATRQLTATSSPSTARLAGEQVTPTGGSAWGPRARLDGASLHFQRTDHDRQASDAGVAAAMQQAHAAVLALVDTAESHVRSSGSGAKAPSGPAAAFAAGKANIMSVLKRYHAHLAWTRSPVEAGRAAAPAGPRRGAAQAHQQAPAQDRWRPAANAAPARHGQYGSQPWRRPDDTARRSDAGSRRADGNRWGAPAIGSHTDASTERWQRW
jgi:hypothetical protein